MTTGKELNVRWNVGAKHAFYRETGDWYENLDRFPGALFDAYGYIIFHTLKEYEESPYLQIGKQLAVPKGISSIPGYIRMEFQISQKPITEEISAKEQIFEGAKLRVTINAYERSSVARKECIEHLGTNCSVCSIKFAKLYGQIGNDFIHVHHIKPLSQVKEGYTVDPIKDLVPVCPNCHAMLHRQEPPFTIDELKSIMRKQREKTNTNNH